MAVNKCDKCFYALMDKESEAPCVTCRGYSNFVEGSVYATSHSSKPLKEAIDEWFSNANGVTSEDFWAGPKYDTVSKPKHYMLFEEEGIEVRDVIRELVAKIANKTGQGELSWSPLAESDYVQMMQYLMRFMDKNGAEDLKKARVYLNWLIEAYDDNV